MRQLRALKRKEKRGARRGGGGPRHGDERRLTLSQATAQSAFFGSSAQASFASSMASAKTSESSSALLLIETVRLETARRARRIAGEGRDLAALMAVALVLVTLAAFMASFNCSCAWLR